MGIKCFDGLGCGKCTNEHYQKGYDKGRADAIEECIEIVKNSYRMDALDKLEQLKEQKNE